MIKVRKRSKVLRFSLNLELIASKVVAYLLNIETIENSYSFGNKSSALSFNQKLNLLLDNNSITKEEKFKLEAFSNIRNQFMHNINANSYQEAFDKINGLENKIRKVYPNKFSDEPNNEIALERCVEELFLDGIKILTSFKGGAEKKMTAESEAKLYKEYLDKQKKSIKKNFDELNKSLKNFEGDMIKKENLIGILELMKIQIVSSSVIDLNIFEIE